MRTHKKAIILSIPLIFLLLFALVSAYLYVGYDVDKTEDKKISVIVYGNNADRWSTLKQGIDQGAADFGVEVNFVTMSSEYNPQEQEKLIEREINNGAEGIMLAVTDSKEMEDAVNRALLKVPVVTIETGIENEKSVPYISADNYSMGLNIGRSVILNNNLEEKIAILFSGNERKSVKDRYRGLRDCLKYTQNVMTIWEMGSNDYSLTLFIDKMMKEDPVDVIVALDDVGLESVVDVIEESGNEIEAFGIGSTDKIVYYLDKGTIKSIVFQNEFNMGYIGIHTVVNEIEGNKEVVDTRIEYRAVNKKTMYVSDNQRLLFPIVQ